jgi:hypothetical protein
MPAYGDVGVEHHTALETTLLEQSACALIQTHESRVSFIYVCIDTYSACLVQKIAYLMCFHLGVLRREGL